MAWLGFGYRLLQFTGGDKFFFTFFKLFLNGQTRRLSRRIARFAPF